MPSVIFHSSSFGERGAFYSGVYVSEICHLTGRSLFLGALIMANFPFLDGGPMFCYGRDSPAARLYGLFSQL